MCPYGRELFVEKAEIHFILEEFFNGLLGIADIVHVEQLHGRVGITAGQRQGDNSHTGENGAYGIGDITSTIKG